MGLDISDDKLFWCMVTSIAWQVFVVVLYICWYIWQRRNSHAHFRDDLVVFGDHARRSALSSRRDDLEASADFRASASQTPGGESTSSRTYLTPGASPIARTPAANRLKKKLGRGSLQHDSSRQIPTISEVSIEDLRAASRAHRIVNLGVGALMVVGGILQFFSKSTVQSIIVGCYVIIFGLSTALLEFQIPPQLSRYASFLFSFLGRGIFYIFVGSILLHDFTVAYICGSIIGFVGVAYVVLEFVPSIEPPQNMREADGGWGAEQV